MNKCPETDERTTVVENYSYRYGYLLVVYALLIDVACQAWRYGRSSWDLLAIVIGSGAFVSLYQAKKRVLTKSWLRRSLLVAVVAAAVAALSLLVLT